MPARLAMAELDPALAFARLNPLSGIKNLVSMQQVANTAKLVVLAAVLLEQLRGAFDAIKKHYKLINLICGGLLVVTGILMMTGLLQKVLGAVSV